MAEVKYDLSYYRITAIHIQGAALKVIAEELKEPIKRLTFDIPKSLHARIKAGCAVEEKFMNEEIIKLLEAHWPARE